MAKVDGAASTAEQAANDLAALERELAGYQARLASAKAGRNERLSEGELTERVKAVEAEIKRVKPAAKKADDDA
jgi:hypothetical protein